MPDKLSLSFEAGFPAEASLLKNLNHPGIPIIYDIEEDDTYYYIIEEFIRGESLDTFVLHQETISQELIIEFCIQLCEILDYLHHYAPYPILYQDLKPEHIILCGNQLKLIDFGIASFFTGSGKHFQKFGTKGYAAPEAVAVSPLPPRLIFTVSARFWHFSRTLCTRMFHGFYRNHCACNSR